MNRRILNLNVVILFLVISGTAMCFGAQKAWAASAKSTYIQADQCHRELKKSPSRQKYRDQWLRCINEFLDAYKREPRGTWASASLYKAGSLYAELYTHSFYKGDKQEALDIFDRVIRGYPKSAYRNKAIAARKELKQGGQNTPKVDERKAAQAREYYKLAEDNYKKLQKSPRLKKYRDQWFHCIKNYEKAYKSYTQGPDAAAALFAMASRYEELARYSFKSDDREQAITIFKDIIKKFPDSDFDEKSKSALLNLGEGTSKGNTDKNDSRTQVVDNIDDDDQIAGIIKGDQRDVANDVNSVMASSEHPAMVENLRFWSNPRYTRVVIDATSDTAFTYHELREDPSIGKPRRIYIDVHNSRLGKNLQKLIPINDNLLRNARAGQYSKDTVRVVVDIKSFKTFKIFSLKNPFRVVLDVWGIDTEHEGDTAGLASAGDEKEKDGKKIQPSAIAKQLALGVRRIVIDPGHGGKDYGAPGYLKGVHEKYVVMQIAKRLKKMVAQQLKCEVILTRNSDTYLSLEERTAIANTQNADLFVSIHTNASQNRRAYGVETYILNLATDDEAIRVAAMENATSAKNISDLDSILHDLMQNAKVNESTRLASYVQQEMYKRLKAKYSNIRNKGIKQAPFYVLLGADMPSILVETSFISNSRECKRLTDPTYQKRLCEGIVEGIKRYIKETKPLAGL